MLIMVFSSVQAAVNDYFMEHSVKCPMSEMHLVAEQSTSLSSDNDQPTKLDTTHSNHCQLHPQCTAHINLTSLLDLNLDQLAFRLPIRNILISGDELVLSIYPTLSKRPPKT